MRFLVLAGLLLQASSMQPQAPTPMPAQPRSIEEVRIRSGVYTPAPPTITAQANLVEVGATVHDPHGRLATGLAESDFELLDNGKPQKIQFFSERTRDAEPAAAAGISAPRAATPAVESPRQPRTIALFFDDTHADNAGLQRSKEGAEKLVTTALGPADRVGVFTQSGTVVTPGFSGDVPALVEAIRKISPHPHIGLRSFLSCPTLSAYQAYLIRYKLDPPTEDTAVAEVCGCIESLCTQPGFPRAHEFVQTQAASQWDQVRSKSTGVMDVLMVIVKHLAAEPGSRILVMVSPGFPTPEMDRNKNAVIDAAVRARIVINTLDSEGLVAGGNQKAVAMRQELLTSFLSDASASTGGTFIKNNNDYVSAIGRLAEPAEESYLLAFSPQREPDGNYHELKLKLKNHPGFSVQARPGYVSVAPPPRPEPIQERIDREAGASDTRSELGASVKASAGQDNGASAVLVDIVVDAKTLKFAASGDRSLQELTFVTLLREPGGRLIAGRQAVMDLNLTSAKLADMQANGIKVSTSIPAVKGVYEIREIVREAGENHFAISNTRVEVP